jgi:hypothetical protein
MGRSPMAETFRPLTSGRPLVPLPSSAQDRVGVGPGPWRWTPHRISDPRTRLTMKHPRPASRAIALTTEPSALGGLATPAQAAESVTVFTDVKAGCRG